MHPIEVFFLNALECSSNKFEQSYIPRTIDNEMGMYYNTSPLSQKLYLHV